MLNLIGGIDTPTSGNVFIKGENVSQLSDKAMTQFRRDNIGFVFQQYNLLPVLTAKENVEFVMEMQNRPKQEREQRVTELLAAIGLADKINERPGKLSGGQQQRVAVARALAHKPSFVIADEPTANLDSKSTEDLLNIMQELNEKEGITFIFSTHDQRVVDKAKRVIVFADGKVISDTSK
uniref:ABC transporter ATP-binding protein n=1 Tax=Gelidibacter sp. TaxID=2018083 RepID=UPI0040496941